MLKKSLSSVLKLESDTLILDGEIGIKAGDKVFLISCHDKVTGEQFYDVWLTKVGQLDWSSIEAQNANPQLGLDFSLHGQREVLSNEKSELYVEIGQRPMSNMMLSALQAVADPDSYKKK